MNQAFGFTLVEVLVALVVAAILASGLLALQQHGLNQAREADLLWAQMNVAQEALMGLDPARTTPQSGPDWQITITEPTPQRSSPWISLTTRGAGRELNWSWPGVLP